MVLSSAQKKGLSIWVIIYPFHFLILFLCQDLTGFLAANRRAFSDPLLCPRNTMLSPTSIKLIIF